MTDSTDVLLRRRVLVVDDALRHQHTAVGRAVSGLVAELRRRGVEVTESVSYEDGAAVVASDAGLCAVLVDWGLDGGTASGDGRTPPDADVGKTASQMLAAIRSRNATLPIFLLARGGSGRPGDIGAEITIGGLTRDPVAARVVEQATGRIRVQFRLDDATRARLAEAVDRIKAQRRPVAA